MNSPEQTPEFPWKKNLYILWTAQFIAMLGMSGCIPFLPLFIRELGVTDLAAAQKWSGFVFAAPFFLAVLATPLWGAMGDKYGKKLMVVRAIFGLMLIMFLMGFCQNVWQLFLLRVVQGGITGFIASNLALVSATAPREHSGYAISILQTSISAGTTIGPLIGGVLADTIGMRSVFFVVTGLCLLSGTIVITSVRDKPNGVVHLRKPLTEDLRMILVRPDLRQFLWYITLCQSGVAFTSPILAYYLEHLHTPAQYLGTITGIMVGCVGLLMTVFGPMWGRKNDNGDYRHTLLLILPVVSLATIAQALVTNYIQLFPLRLLIGIFAGGLLPTLYTALNKHSSPEIQGGVMGMASSATVLGNLVGPIVCSWVASHWGMSWAFVVGGSFIGSVYVAMWTHDHHHAESMRT